MADGDPPALGFAQLAAIVAELPFYVCLVDRDDRILWVNRSAVPLDQVVGASVLEITEPAYRAAAAAGLATARHGAVGGWTGQSAIADIRESYFRATALPIRLAGLPEPLVLLITADVTDQRRAELALEASEARYRALLEAHPDYIATIGPEQGFRSFNRLAPGLTAEVLLASKVDDFLAPESAAVAIPIIERAFRDGTPGRYLGIARLPEGDQHFQVRVIPAPPELDEPRVMLITTDITEAHEAAESIRRGEARLAQAQRLEIVGQLAGGVAHDFNNMLLVIQAHAELAQRRAGDARLVAESLAAIKTATERAAELTKQLLAVARRQTIAVKPVELGGLLDETLRLLERTLPETIRITRRGAGPAWVQGDAGQLGQVLVNLAINARDAMPAGGELGFELGPKPGAEDRTLRLSVRDTGLGIPPELRERVFEPFFTTKEHGLGSGLGLAVAHGIIRQHDGRIEVDSELGRGTCFHIDLPVAAPSTIAPPAPAVTPAFGTAVVLLAEDEEPVRRVVTAMLEGAGYQVVPAADGDEAIARLRERDDIDLAILDAVMPRRTGRDVYDVIVAERPGVAVLFTTGYGAGVLPSDLGSTPGIGLLPKPYGLDELLEQVERLVRPRSR